MAEEKELEKRYEQQELKNFRRVKEEDNSLLFVDDGSILQTKVPQFRGSSIHIPVVSENNFPSQR